MRDNFTVKGLRANISVNISPVQLRRMDFLDMVNRILKEYDIPPQDLIMEITESIFFESSINAVEKLHAIREMGIRLALDDFGTGYSSLNYLLNMPINYIKIDRSFITGLDSDERRAALTSNIIKLSEDLGLYTVAEGVETNEELALVSNLGCNAMQGFLFSKPVSEEEAVRVYMAYN